MIVNGVLTKSDLVSSDSSLDTIKQHIDNLLTNIRDHNKCINSTNTTHKIVLSHIKGFAAALQSVLISEYELFIVVKPGSNSNVLSESITETVKQLSNDDVLVLSSRTNDYELDNFKLTFQNIKEYLSQVTHTNVLVLSIPARYDLQNSTTVNSKILNINKKLSKLTSLTSNISFLDCNNDGKLFTKHGLHRNKLGKKFIIAQIANHIFSIFKRKTPTSLSLAWYNPIEVLPDENQVENSMRNSS
jgi:hypothetical protein